MKKIVFIIMATLLFSSCQKEDENGDLGGWWKMLEIEKVATGVVEDTRNDDRFWAIQLDLMTIGGSYGRFQHVGDSLFVQMIHIPSTPKKYGLYNPKNERFGVRHLDRNGMILQSDSVVLKFRKF